MRNILRAKPVERGLRLLAHVVVIAVGAAVFESSEAVGRDENQPLATLDSDKAQCEKDFNAVCVLQIALDRYLGIGFPLYDDFLTTLAVSAAELGDIEGAIKSFDAASIYAVRDAIPSLMSAMLRAGRLDDALAKANELPRDGDTGIAMISIVRALVAMGDVENSFTVAREIEYHGDRALALAIIAASDHFNSDKAARTVLFAEAVELAETIAVAIRRAGYLFQIAALRLAVEDIGGAEDTIETAFDAARRVQDNHARIGMRNRSFGVFRNQKNSDAVNTVVSRLYRAMKRLNGIRTFIGGYLNAAETTFKIGHVTAAVQILDQARDIALLSQSTVKLEYFLWRIIAARSRFGDIDGALADVTLMPSGDRRGAWMDIAVAQAKVGDIEGIEKLLEAFTNAAPKQEYIFVQITDNPVRYKIIPALLQNGYLKAAYDFAADMDKGYIYYDEAMIEIAAAEAAAGNFDAAFLIPDIFDQPDVRARCLVRIATEYLNQGRMTEARMTLKTAYHQVIDQDPDDSTSRRIGAQSLLKIGVVLAAVESGY